MANARWPWPGSRAAEHARVRREGRSGIDAFRLRHLRRSAEIIGRPRITELRALGVDLKILTGDSAPVTRRVCEEIGFPVTNVLQGKDVDRLNDSGLAAAVETANVFCRMTPVQKNRAILALRGAARWSGI